ncbi:MAG: hypothetical protein CVV44_11325 [Spirochaetae bacterium HGW-Spirochaetae-1]|jgi:hypothetical protein|nr:MAG: hypothetical protein CVV44_11325 [Spirochaetae bacterium HGW-Spirochaetae-1]
MKLMWDVPDKYTTICIDNASGEHIEHLTLEAINDNEAEARAFLNCVNHNNKNGNVRIEVQRL